MNVVILVLLNLHFSFNCGVCGSLSIVLFNSITSVAIGQVSTILIGGPHKSAGQSVSWDVVRFFAVFLTAHPVSWAAVVIVEGFFAGFLVVQTFGGFIDG